MGKNRRHLPHEEQGRHIRGPHQILHHDDRHQEPAAQVEHHLLRLPRLPDEQGRDKQLRCARPLNLKQYPKQVDFRAGAFHVEFDGEIGDVGQEARVGSVGSRPRQSGYCRLYI